MKKYRLLAMLTVLCVLFSLGITAFASQINDDLSVDGIVATDANGNAYTLNALVTALINKTIPCPVTITDPNTVKDHESFGLLPSGGYTYHDNSASGENDTITIPALPSARYDEIETNDLNFAASFTAITPEPDQLAYYGDWYADFALTANKNLTLNANSNAADGYLAGSYASWDAGSWITVPYEDVVLTANTPILVMKTAADMYNQSGLRFVYGEAYEVVCQFLCGAYFTPEYLEANPDLVVTLQLQLINREDESITYPIGDQLVYKAKDLFVASVGDKMYMTLEKAAENVTADETITLLKDITLSASEALCINKTVDITAPEAVTVTGNLSVVANGKLSLSGNLTLDGQITAEDGAVISISGGTFAEEPQEAWIVDGKCAVKETSGMYTVKEHPAGEWTASADGKEHTKSCVNCGTFLTSEPHYHEKAPVCGAQAVCTACNTAYGEAKAHAEKLETTERVEPTYTSAGNVLYYTCPDCGKHFADKTCTTELTDVTLPKLIHVEEDKAEVSVGAVDAAIQEAAASGSKTDVTLDLTHDEVIGEENSPVSSAELPVAALKKVADIGNDATLTLQKADATVTLDSKALETVSAIATGTTVTLVVEEIPEAQLNQQQQAAVEEKDVIMVISAKLICTETNQPIATEEDDGFGGGKVTIQIPFDPEEGTAGTDYVVLYVADDGSIETLDTAYTNGCLVIELDHFSEYVISKKTTTVPETTVPETTVPETTVPETTVPETTVPETTVPATTTPATTTPATTAPATTQPSGNVPSTGDHSNILLFTTMLLTSAMMLLCLLILRKKSHT